MLGAGSLNRRITVQSQSSIQDEYGQPQAVWADLLECWASILAATSREVYAASGFTSQITHKLTIRYPALKVTSGMRVLYQSRTFLIQGVSDADESRRQLNLFCLETDGGA